MKQPEVRVVTLTEDDVITAVELLLVEGKPTGMCCAGSVCVRRETVPSSKDAVDIRYNRSQVMIRHGNGNAKFWRKSSVGAEIDVAYDSAWQAAWIKFGPSQTWRAKRRQIRNFFLKKMKPFIGLSFTLTELPKRAKKGEGVSHDIDPVTGKVKGGLGPRTLCSPKTRNAQIDEMLSQLQGEALAATAGA